MTAHPPRPHRSCSRRRAPQTNWASSRIAARRLMRSHVPSNSSAVAKLGATRAPTGISQLLSDVRCIPFEEYVDVPRLRAWRRRKYASRFDRLERRTLISELGVSASLTVLDSCLCESQTHRDQKTSCNRSLASRHRCHVHSSPSRPARGSGSTQGSDKDKT